ncbi:MAG: SigE family RNA polymerase sigma factor [Actinomycetota bacterium]|nr:SigE family RNA polymerase sigma factor [Actinomycetota bacterium]
MTTTEGVRMDLAESPGRAEDPTPAVLPEVITFAAFFRREYHGLVALAWGLTGSREAAEDLAQEALLSLHRRWDQPDYLDNPKAYVRRTCANLSVSWIRRRVAETRALLRVGRPDAEAVELSDEAGSFWAEVRRLPRRQAQVVALFYGYDLTVAEVSETLNMSTGTVKTHLHRARATLAVRMGADAEMEQEEPDVGR